MAVKDYSRVIISKLSKKQLKELGLKKDVEYLDCDHQNNLNLKDNISGQCPKRKKLDLVV